MGAVIRINKAGGLDRGEMGPVLVIYSDNVWYTHVDESALDEIVDEHLVQRRIVERLLIS